MLLLRITLLLAGATAGRAAVAADCSAGQFFRSGDS